MRSTPTYDQRRFQNTNIQSSHSKYFGPLLGLGFQSGTSINFGADAGMKITNEWSGGLYLTYSTSSESVAGVTASSSLIIFAPEANYDFHNGFRAGAKLGLASSSTKVAASTTFGITLPEQKYSSSGIVFGGAAMYDKFISPDWSIGGEANLLLYSVSSNTGSSSTSAINLLGSAKYWF